MIPKALLTAAADPNLRPLALRLYVFVHGQLDYLTYRPLKTEWLSRMLQADQGNVSRAISSLTDRGYLERGGRDNNHIGLYRLPYSPGRAGMSGLDIAAGS